MSKQRRKRASVVEMLERRVLLDAVPVGPEFRVNTYTPDNQTRPSIAMNASGDFVIAWNSVGQDGSEVGVFAQRFSASGAPLGSEFQVNTYTTGVQSYPSVAMNTNGDFVVVWDSFGQEGPGSNIYAQRYDAAGGLLGGEFRVNTWTTGHQRSPTVAMDDDGDFVATWESYGQDGSQYGIYAQRFDAGGLAQGPEFRVNSHTERNQWFPDVAMSADGRFVVTWSSFGQGATSWGVYGQFYTAAGSPDGDEFRVNSFTTGVAVQPSAAMSPDGAIVVAWDNRASLAANVHYDVHARRYDAAGTQLGGEFRVNTTTTNEQRRSSVAMDSDGNFVVAWEGALQDGSGRGVFAHHFNADGVPLGGEFRVNTWTTGHQGLPAAAMDADGDFVVAWHSDGQDGSGYGIFAQRYTVIAAPETTDSTFIFATAPHRLDFTFNTNVSASLGTDDLIVENLTTSQTIPADQFALAYDAASNTATFTYIGGGGVVPGVLPDGNYRATLLAAGITNPAGTPMPADHVFDFFFLNGDATRDGIVGKADFDRLAANFGQSGPGIDFTRGDFNYDGTVNLADFNILAGRFGMALGPASFSSALFAKTTPQSDEPERERESDEILA